MNGFLLAAVVLAFVVGLLHSVVGERLIFNVCSSRTAQNAETKKAPRGAFFYVVHTPAMTVGAT